MRIAILVVVAVALVSPTSYAGSFEKAQRGYPRVRAAFEKHRAAVEREFELAGAAWPPRGIFLRAFKHEGVLELWAEPSKSKARVLVRRFPICAASGELGPKAKEGDYQVPEGFYTIDRFNPRSSYHLSLGIDYPNAVDRQRAPGSRPGGDIFIHGNCVTVGCLPLQDDPVEALYVAAVLARDNGQQSIPVHLFPCRFGTNECKSALAEADAEHAPFWKQLAEGFSAFETTKIPPRYVATADGYTKK